MSDIVERLRAGENFYGESSLWFDRDLAAAVDEAADEIERLRGRVRVLECALRFYANPGDYKAPFTGGMGALYFDCGSIARAALEKP